MKLIALVALFGLLGAALIVEEPAENCDPVVQLDQLDPLTQEEQVDLSRFDAAPLIASVTSRNRPKALKRMYNFRQVAARSRVL